MSAIAERYGSLDAPQYKFVDRLMREQPYKGLEQLLSALADEVHEETDPNDDVAFGYVLKRGKETLFLQLSMIGPYALLQRVRQGNRNELVALPVGAGSDFEKAVVEAVKRLG